MDVCEHWVWFFDGVVGSLSAMHQWWWWVLTLLMMLLDHGHHSLMVAVGAHQWWLVLGEWSLMVVVGH